MLESLFIFDFDSIQFLKFEMMGVPGYSICFKPGILACHFTIREDMVMAVSPYWPSSLDED